MGIKPPEKKFKIPDRINGIAMQAFVAGRAECTIRRTPVPVTYLDFHAQFPAVSKLLDCREILSAKSLEFADFTAGARQLLEHVKPDDCLPLTIVAPGSDHVHDREAPGTVSLPLLTETPRTALT
jgi:hypothetical protein